MMELKIKVDQFETLYNRAIADFWACMHRTGNEYLKEEVGVPLESIRPRGTSVKIKYSFDDSSNYLVEIEVWLFDSESEIKGVYTRIEDTKGLEVDNGLVFY